MGTTLREIIYNIGGGLLEDRPFKAVQTGGPSGGCLPVQYLDMSVEYDTLKSAGSIMGSGGMIVMDHSSSMVDVARYFMEFCMSESCGKCIPCRAGTYHMYKLLDKIAQGEATRADLELLEEMCEVVRMTSLCGLGQTAPNPVLSTIQYFRDEFKAHIEQKRCPAGVCKALTSYYIQPDKCQACQICLRNCPVQGVSGGNNIIHIIDQAKCTRWPRHANWRRATSPFWTCITLA